MKAWRIWSGWDQLWRIRFELDPGRWKIGRGRMFQVRRQAGPIGVVRSVRVWRALSFGPLVLMIGPVDG